MLRRVLRALGVGVGALLALLVGAVVAARFHDGPLGPFQGGRLLAGELVSEPVRDGSFVAQARELELGAERPRSVTTWRVVHDGALYVPSALASRKRWPSEVVANGRVLVRIEGRRDARQAVRVEDPELLRALRSATGREYGFGGEGADEDAWDTWFFRLDARAGS